MNLQTKVLICGTGLPVWLWPVRHKVVQILNNYTLFTEQFATAEIERYMAIPGQALSYKVGELKIRELRNKY